MRFLNLALRFLTQMTSGLIGSHGRAGALIMMELSGGDARWRNPQPFPGWGFPPLSLGWAPRADPGLHYAIPLGLDGEPSSGLWRGTRQRRAVIKARTIAICRNLSEYFGEVRGGQLRISNCKIKNWGRKGLAVGRPPNLPTGMSALRAAQQARFSGLGGFCTALYRFVPLYGGKDF